jgi:diguanylate cyclase (GGDEF)-like protein/PAS domain S-box-containing protein
MDFHPGLPAYIFFISALVVLLIALRAWNAKPFPGRNTLTLTLLASAEWALTAGMVNAVYELPHKILWAKIEYIGALSAPILLFLFNGYYTNFFKRPESRKFLAIWIIPAVTFILALTNETHHLIWSGFQKSEQIAGLIIFEHGLFFYVWIVYAYIFMVLTLIIQARAFVYASPVFRSQAGLLLLSNLFPLLINVFFVLNLNPFPGLDVTPMSFVITGIILGWGIIRFRLFNLLPVARDVLVNHMNDGILVTDILGRIVDVNPSLTRYFGLTESVAGQLVGNVFSAYPEIAAFVSDVSLSRTVLSIQADKTCHFDISQIALENPPGALVGYLTTFHDVTRLKEIEEALEMKTLELYQKSVIDDLTGLYNRRHVNDVLQKQIILSRFHPGSTFSVGFFDLDSFKLINDRFGHNLGDKALIKVAETIRATIRDNDVPVRLGGDEFLIVFPYTNVDDAWNVMERLRGAINQLDLGSDGVRLSISGGMAAVTEGTNIEDILRMADKRLYGAKKSGKNTILKTV